MKKGGYMIRIFILFLLMTSAFSRCSTIIKRLVTKMYNPISAVKIDKTQSSGTPEKTHRGETFFYCKNGTPITEKDHSHAYDALLCHQFPMHLAHNNGAPYNPNELEAIAEDIKTKCPHVNVGTLPKTVYELCAINFLDNNIDHVLKYRSSIPLHEATLGMDTTSCERFNKKTRETHYHVNNHILDLLTKKIVQKQELTHSDYKHFLKKNPTLLQYTSLSPDKNISPLSLSCLSSIIDHEIQENKNNKFLLYRGTRFVNMPDTTDKRQCSLSFGSSLFGGIYFDQGAGAFHYLENLASGYLVPIDKKEYMENNLKNMFHIPALTTLGQLLGKGEHFHPRTKVKYQDNEIYGFAIGGALVPASYVIPGDTAEKEHLYNKIFEYIEKNRIILDLQKKHYFFR